MKKYFFGVLATLLLSLLSFAGELDVPKTKRVINLPSGCCVWASLETLGNVHGIKSLTSITQYRHDKYGQVQVYIQGTYIQTANGLVQIQSPHYEIRNDAPGTADRVIEEMTRLKVSCKLQKEKDFDLTLITTAVKDNLGAAVGFRDFPNPGNYHMVTVTDLTADKVVFIDNRDCARYEGSREWFKKHWSGFTIVVYPMPKPAIKEEK